MHTIILWWLKMKYLTEYVKFVFYENYGTWTNNRLVFCSNFRLLIKNKVYMTITWSSVTSLLPCLLHFNHSFYIIQYNSFKIDNNIIITDKMTNMIPVLNIYTMHRELIYFVIVLT